MWWIIVLIPICAWLSYSILLNMNILSLVIILLVIAGFMLYEISKMKTSESRSKLPFAVMIVMALSVIISIAVNLIK
jgi:hypothetical protein